jgi:hypothetical protein
METTRNGMCLNEVYRGVFGVRAIVAHIRFLCDRSPNDWKIEWRCSSLASRVVTTRVSTCAGNI